MEDMICLEGISGVGKTTQLSLINLNFPEQFFIMPELNNFSPLNEEIQSWKQRSQDYKVPFSFLESDSIKLAKARALSQEQALRTFKGNHPTLDKRYKEVAIAAINGGPNLANRQV